MTEITDMLLAIEKVVTKQSDIIVTLSELIKAQDKRIKKLEEKI